MDRSHELSISIIIDNPTKHTGRLFLLYIVHVVALNMQLFLISNLLGSYSRQLLFSLIPPVAFEY
jgi:hypothetical protein